MNLDEASVQAGLASLPPVAEQATPDFEVYPENWETVLVFLALQTQWRCGPMGGLQGLDYPAVEVVLRLRQVSEPAALFERLQGMERAAIAADRGEGDHGGE